MTIRAVVKNGAIQPLGPLPAEWVEGQELVVEEPLPAESEADLNAWAAQLEAGAARLPAEDTERFLKALDEVERESKEAVAREWGLRG
jgi:hypothetical protein